MSTLRAGTSEPVPLAPGESVPQRPFTSVELIDRDVSILYGILGDLRGLLEEAAQGTRTLVPYRHMAWRIDGLAHRHIVCNEARLRVHPGLCLVAFFGERNTELDITPLEKANTALVAEFINYPGITSYSSLELPGDQWANLVVHDDPVDTDFWRRSSLHAQAVRKLAPGHYLNVRIHNARLSADLFGDPAIVIKRTKYWDYSGGSEWRAERVLAV